MYYKQLRMYVKETRRGGETRLGNLFGTTQHVSVVKRGSSCVPGQETASHVGYRDMTRKGNVMLGALTWEERPQAPTLCGPQSVGNGARMRGKEGENRPSPYNLSRAKLSRGGREREK